MPRVEGFFYRERPSPLSSHKPLRMLRKWQENGSISHRVASVLVPPTPVPLTREMLLISPQLSRSTLLLSVRQVLPRGIVPERVTGFLTSTVFLFQDMDLLLVPLSGRLSPTLEVETVSEDATMLLVKHLLQEF